MQEGAVATFLFPEAARFVCVDVDDESLGTLDPLLPGEGPPGSARWVAKRLREFRAGRHVARRVLVELGCPPAALVRDADGVPKFPRGVAASITHTGTRRSFAAAAGIRGARGLGLDAEQSRALPSDVVERILDEDERRQLSHFGPIEELSLLAFSAKEAFYKCVYPSTRRFLEFSEVDFQLLELKPHADFRWGKFLATSLSCHSHGGPLGLEGRFVWTNERVLTAVIWEP